MRTQVGRFDGVQKHVRVREEIMFVSNNGPWMDFSVRDGILWREWKAWGEKKGEQDESWFGFQCQQRQVGAREVEYLL